MHKIRLKPGKEKSLLRKHPWIFSGAIQSTDKNITNGESVQVMDAAGRCHGTGAFSPASQIRTRLWTFNPDEKINADFFRQKIIDAKKIRDCFVKNSNAYRVINAESDGFPGLIVDRYDQYLVCQFLSAGTEYHKPVIIDQLQDVLAPVGIYERSDADVRQKEGLSATTGVLTGADPPSLIDVYQDGIKFLVDIRTGHKTGMYLDQRENRQKIRELAKDREVLNCFSYTGGFSLAALLGGARNVVNIESSGKANELYRQQLRLNDLDGQNTTTVEADVFTTLREYQNSSHKYDLIILDPPKFITNAQQITRGCRGYKDINMQAMKLLKPGGLLVTFSCSGHLAVELFQKIVADAAIDAGRNVKIISTLGQPVDHPVLLSFPEGRYLKGLVCCA